MPTLSQSLDKLSAKVFQSPGALRADAVFTQKFVDISNQSAFEALDYASNSVAKLRCVLGGDDKMLERLGRIEIQEDVLKQPRQHIVKRAGRVWEGRGYVSRCSGVLRTQRDIEESTTKLCMCEIPDTI